MPTAAITDRQAILAHFHDRLTAGSKRLLSSEERTLLIEGFVELLKGVTTQQEIEALCQAELELLESGYGQGTNTTSSYLSKYRTAIAGAVEAGVLPMTQETSHEVTVTKQATGESFTVRNHWAWSLMRYDNSVYIANRKATNVSNNQRQDNPLPFNPDRYLEKAKELLGSGEPESVAVGIAAVTGRRHTEVVVSGRFSPTAHPYLLHFEGQLKKQLPIAYDILTLLPVSEVLEAIDRFQSMPQVQQLVGLTSEDQPVQNFRARVNTRVKQHFERTQILPVLPGFQSVSIHRLRAVYGRMAIYFWLPNTGTNEQRFLQHYLGHVLESQVGEANSNSTTHYFGYWLANEQGKPITARGIKLMANPPLPRLSEQQVQQQYQANLQLAQMEQGAIEADDGYVEQEMEQEVEMNQGEDEAIQSVAEPTPHRRSRSKAIVVDCDLLKAVASRFGIQVRPGRGYGYEDALAQLLEVLEQANFSLEEDEDTEIEEDEVEEVDQVPLSDLVITQAISDQAKTLAWFSDRISSLEMEVNQLRTERDDLQQRLASSDGEHSVSSQLKLENQQLHSQLQQAQSKLQQFRSLLDGGNGTQEQQQQAGKLDISTDSSPAPLQQVLPYAPKSDRSPSTRKGGSAKDRAHRIFLAIQQWNHLHPDDTWAVTVGLLEEGFGINRKAAKEFVQENQQAIWQHHQEIGVQNERGHNRGKETIGLRGWVEARERGDGVGGAERQRG